MARLQPQRPHGPTAALDRPQLQLASDFSFKLPPRAVKSLHTALENLPDEVVTMIIALLPAGHVKRFALTCRLFAAWADLIDVVNADMVGDDSDSQLCVRGHKLRDLFQRRTIRSLVLAQSRQFQDHRTSRAPQKLTTEDTAELFKHRPALQHLQLLALEYLELNPHTTDLVLELANALGAAALPQLRSLTLAGIVPSIEVPRLLDGAAKCPLLYYLDFKDLKDRACPAFRPSMLAPPSKPYQYSQPFAQPSLQRSLKLLDLSQNVDWAGAPLPERMLPARIRSGLLDSLHNYRAIQVLDVSGAISCPAHFKICSAVIQLPELRELYMRHTDLFGQPDETLANFWAGLAALGGERIDRMGDYHGPRGLQLLDIGGLVRNLSPRNTNRYDDTRRRQRQMLQACLQASNPAPLSVPRSHSWSPALCTDAGAVVQP